MLLNPLNKGNIEFFRTDYLASVAAVRHNNELKQIFKNQLSSGRAKKEALIIITRKLAYIIWAIYKHNKPYDPARVFVAHP